jgi:Cdc6-like AAA superfamily ATPase
MKNLQTFEEFLNESLNERRVSFKGKTTNDLYKIVKTDPDATIFANGKHYSILDPEEMRNDLKNDSTFAYDEDGGEHEVKIKDIEFIEL